ncbi:MAG: formylglycine-generating enzyme family protein [Microscillaceae bacterium]|jgi:sulfatase modifying factor 1|nr:formylglycine-generating enzyme family protein [Microscillaceae bacterium]
MFRITLIIYTFLNSYLLDNQSLTAQNPDKTPENMVLLKGGRTKIGSNEGLDNEKPVFSTDLMPFYLDKNPVTVAQFRLFVKINRYITDAEKKGEGMSYDEASGKWMTIPGATWEYPQGRNQPKAAGDEPVRQVSWNDAKAYANWLGKRLPNEFELEYAAHQAEKLGLQNLEGALWQWCDNWYTRYDQNSYYRKQELNRQKTLKGGTASATSANSGASRVFRPSMRSYALPETAAFSIGFRCAKDVQ